MTPGRRNALTVFAAVVSCVVFARGITGYDGGRTDDARAKKTARSHKPDVTKLTVAALREALPACPHLAALDVSHCSALGHAAVSLIAAHCTRLVELNLAAVGAVDDVATEVARA